MPLEEQYWQSVNISRTTSCLRIRYPSAPIDCMATSCVKRIAAGMLQLKCCKCYRVVTVFAESFPMVRTVNSSSLIWFECQSKLRSIRKDWREFLVSRRKSLGRLEIRLILFLSSRELTRSISTFSDKIRLPKWKSIVKRIDGVGWQTKTFKWNPPTHNELGARCFMMGPAWWKYTPAIQRFTLWNTVVSA